MKPPAYLLILFTLLPGFSFALNISALRTEFSHLSTCTLGCMIPTILNSGCSIANETTLQSCLCTNGTAESIITGCIMQGCSFTDHIESEKIQELLCAGEPYPSRRPQLIFATIFLSILVILCVSVRCWSRYYVAKKFWWDDWFVLVATGLFLTLQAVTAWGTAQGFGLHIWNAKIITPKISKDLYLYLFLYEIFYCAVQYTTKLSIVLLYHRIFPIRWMQIVVYFACVFVTLHFIAYQLVTTFQCKPIARSWDHSINGSCLDFQPVILSAAILTIVEDVFMIALPVPSILALKLNLKKKIGVVFAMSVGLIAVASSLIRLRFVVNFAQSVDILWYDYGIALTSMIEMSVSIACVCFPAIRHLLTTRFPHAFGSFGSANSNFMQSLKLQSSASTPVVTTSANSGGSQPVREPMSIGKRLLDWFDGLWVFERNESSNTTDMRSRRRGEGGVSLEEVRKSVTPNTIDQIDTAEKAEAHTIIVSAI